MDCKVSLQELLSMRRGAEVMRAAPDAEPSSIDTPGNTCSHRIYDNKQAAEVSCSHEHPMAKDHIHHRELQENERALNGMRETVELRHEGNVLSAVSLWSKIPQGHMAVEVCCCKKPAREQPVERVVDWGRKVNHIAALTADTRPLAPSAN